SIAEEEVQEVGATSEEPCEVEGGDRQSPPPAPGKGDHGGRPPGARGRVGVLGARMVISGATGSRKCPPSRGNPPSLPGDTETRCDVAVLRIPDAPRIARPVRGDHRNSPPQQERVYGPLGTPGGA